MCTAHTCVLTGVYVSAHAHACACVSVLVGCAWSVSRETSSICPACECTEPHVHGYAPFHMHTTVCTKTSAHACECVQGYAHVCAHKYTHTCARLCVGKRARAHVRTSTRSLSFSAGILACASRIPVRTCVRACVRAHTCVRVCVCMRAVRWGGGGVAGAGAGW